MKKEVQENFKRKQARRCQRKLTKQANMNRKLLDTGASRDEIEKVLNDMDVDPDIEQEDDHVSDDADTDSDSTSEWRPGKVRGTTKQPPQARATPTQYNTKHN